ncbi:hypothetical protein [Sansalvadorimonas verongulae]|uniref:hypothetical protein n=1 Tax=Sansalvadorimonas verongulae TaxID=2172824 RepID=UPI0012BCC74D|nr:hypothetical protein [Sansalvadorimonas verongulae]MTI12039.1 hypothetical protein [Sansalvadorimonas verongulae]
MATTNPWKQFQGLLPKASRIIGTVTSHNSNGTSTLTLRNGSTITVRGQTVAVGQKVLVEDGEVRREVPDLPVYNVQI